MVPVLRLLSCAETRQIKSEELLLIKREETGHKQMVICNLNTTAMVLTIRVDLQKLVRKQVQE